MNHKLIVIANPIKESFSYAILNSVIHSLREETYTVIDLYWEWQQEYLNFENGVPNHPKSREEMQSLITKSDEIILIFPIWWWIFPAVMKNFFDFNFLIGYAFDRNQDGLIEPWLKWKKISVFSTCNSPATRYSKYLWQYLDLHFVQCCWMEIGNFEILWWITFRSDWERKDFLDHASSLYT